MQLPNVTQPGIWRQTKYNSEREREKQGGQVGYFIAILFPLAIFGSCGVWRKEPASGLICFRAHIGIFSGLGGIFLGSYDLATLERRRKKEKTKKIKKETSRLSLELELKFLGSTSLLELNTHLLAPCGTRVSTVISGVRLQAGERPFFLKCAILPGPQPQAS